MRALSINKVMITGNLTRDPELRTTQSGTSTLRLGVAVNDRRRNPQTGNWEDVPNFVDCTVFGNRAEALSRILTKGMKVAIEGRLRYSSWDDRQTGQKRSKLEVVVDELEFMSSRGGQGGSDSRQGASYGGQGRAQQPTYSAPSQYGGASSYQGAPQQAAPVQEAPAPGVPQTSDDDLYDQEIPF